MLIEQCSAEKRRPRALGPSVAAIASAAVLAFVFFQSIVAGLVLVALLLGGLCLTGLARVFALFRVLDKALPSELRATAYAGQPFLQLRQSIVAACSLIEGMSHRTPRRHSLTGMNTREVLIERMTACRGPAMLGLVELSDFDALCAQNVDSADVLLKAFAARAVRMTAGNRLIAQIDRARFAIWFEAGNSTEWAREFDAQCYALGSHIKAGGLDIVPRIATWSTIVDSDVEQPSAVLARAIAKLGKTEQNDGAANAPPGDDRGSMRLTLEQDLRQAVTRHQFELLYQPFIDAERGSVCGAEALIRWDHPELGRVTPDEFVPLVESTGLAEEVGLWVLDTAISDAANWYRAGLTDVSVAVNLSAHQLRRPELDTIVARMTGRHALPGEMLELELTETVAALDCATACILFDRLRTRGISISIDDFGAGYSSLSYLKKLRFDKLKIDREFITHVDTDRESQAICQSVIALGRGLGITVLAEGIERHEEYVWLRRHGCRFFQGYYFSRPLGRAAFMAFAQDGDGVAEKTDLGPAALLNKVRTSVA